MIGCKEDLLLKLEKIIALKNKGQGGERKAATILLKRLCHKYSLSASDIESISNREYIFHYKTKLELKLFNQIYYSLTGENTIYYCYRDKSIAVNVTPALFVELSAQYDFYRSEFNRSLGEFLEAFIARHHIYNQKDKYREPKTCEEVLKAARISRMAGGIGGNDFNKQIKGGNNKEL